MAKVVKYTYDENGKRSWTLEDEITSLSELTKDDSNQTVSTTEKTKIQQQVIFTYTL